MNLLRTKIAPIAVVSILASSLHAADLTIVPDIPTENLLLSRGDGAPLGTAPIQQTFGFRNLDDAGTEGTRARGQSFVIEGNPGSDYAISSLTVSLNNSGDDAGYRPDGQLQLTVFELDGSNADDFSQWSSGTGGTAGSQIFSTTFPIASDIVLPASDFLNIDFANGELTLTDGKAYGFLFLYTLDELVDADGLALNEDVTIAFDSDNGAEDNTPGALLSTNPATAFADAPNNVSVSRDLNYFITGTAVDSGFAITNYSHDPVADTVTLEWVSRPGETFAVQFSTDLTSWDGDLNDSVPANAAGETTEETFDLRLFGIDTARDLFFRVTKVVPEA